MQLKNIERRRDRAYENALPLVSDLAAYLDMSQPFTTFRFRQD
jgi:hypothetical protein